MSPNQELKQARERAGKTTPQVAQAMGFTLPQYEDMEWFEDELYMCVDLEEILRICEYLNLSISDLFAADRGAISGRSVTGFPGLAEAVREYLRERGLTLSDFEGQSTGSTPDT